ncbi:MAG TPA: 4-(cytidine 5'-diphospho)-2-C-methyl-D-erythritol kinase [Marmoricola sp.]|nr:4-(cytidine 5'-diphospho)-2-C-methyl-D-erythritol kinase [Marmoricola sp.]
MTAEVRVTAPAKINLCLGVGPVREDGYHPLATVYQAVGLYDDLTLRPARLPELTVSGDGVDTTDVPEDERNLAWRAVELLAEHHGHELAVSMHIRKRIPVAGGLAGGSTDAAAALVGADALFRLRTPRPELLALAAELGSDVPFCVEGGTAIGSGRGELVAPVMTRGEYWWVLVPGQGGLSTPAVYEKFDRLSGPAVPHPGVPDELLAALRAGDPHRLGAALTNDLEPAALSFRPALAELLACGRQASAHGALVSGSGPTTVFLCESAAHAEVVDLHLQREAGTAPALVVRGPVPGARAGGGPR